MEAQPDGNRVAAGSAIKGVLAGLVSLYVIGLPTTVFVTDTS